MVGAVAIAAAKKRGVSGWRLVAALVLLAFTVQSYVAQTHFHDAGLAGTAIAKNLGQKKSPVDDNPLNCPFCQAVAHAGAIFLPGTPLLFLSAQWIETAAPHFILRDNEAAPTHSWQSRGPPLP
jgi:hypothetical protein